jgi:hypothetical protein
MRRGTLTRPRLAATLSGMTSPHARTDRWTRVHYDRLVEAGLLQPGDPVEWLGGQLFVAEPQGSAHFTAIPLAADALRRAFGFRSPTTVGPEGEAAPLAAPYARIPVAALLP